MVYHDMDISLNLLSENQAGKLFKAMMRYSKNGEAPELNDDLMLQMAWSFAVRTLDRDSERYEDVKLKRAYAAYCKWAKERSGTPVSFEEWMQMNADGCTCTDVHSGALQTMPTTTPAPTPITTPTPTLKNSNQNQLSDRKTAETIGGMGGKETTTNADAFLSRHAGIFEDSDTEFKRIAAERMRDVEQYKASRQ